MSEGEKRPPPDESTATSPPARRVFLRAGAAAAAGGLLLARALETRPWRPADPEPRVTVHPACADCTGCIAVCPEAAIVSAPGGIEILEERCTRCGYCVAVCPVEALQVGRERGPR